MEQSITAQGPSLDIDHGYYAAVSVTTPLKETLSVCQTPENVEKILSDLPEKITNFLRLERDSVTSDRIVFRNEDPKASGTLTFHFKKDIYHGGTIISAQALFDKIHFREEGPSTLMNIFLKRLKNLVETGEIPTTKGQPSGREELKPTHH